MTAEEQTALPPPESLPTVARLPGDPSTTGADFSFRSGKTNADYNRSYYIMNREVILARVRAYASENKEKIKAASRRYYLSHKDECIARSRKHRELNPEKCAAIKKRSVSKNPQKKRDTDRRWHQQNAERARASRVRWVERNRERKAAQNKEWILKNPEKAAAIHAQHAHRRRAAMMMCATSDEKAIQKWITEWKTQKRVRCYWCNSIVSPNRCHVDHICALSNGGGHALDNLCISCASCNRRKSAKNLAEWNKQIEEPVLL